MFPLRATETWPLVIWVSIVDSICTGLVQPEPDLSTKAMAIVFGDVASGPEISTLKNRRRPSGEKAGPPLPDSAAKGATTGGENAFPSKALQ